MYCVYWYHQRLSPRLQIHLRILQFYLTVLSVSRSNIPLFPSVPSFLRKNLPSTRVQWFRRFFDSSQHVLLVFNNTWNLKPIQTTLDARYPIRRFFNITIQLSRFEFIFHPKYFLRLRVYSLATIEQQYTDQISLWFVQEYGTSRLHNIDIE